MVASSDEDDDLPVSAVPKARTNARMSVFGRHLRDLHRYLARRLRVPQDADDLTQEVYLRLLRVDDAKLVHKPLAYIYGIAAHVLADFRVQVAHDEQHLVAPDELPEGWLERASEALEDMPEENLSVTQQIEEALRQLPEITQAVLILHKRDELTYEEIAERTGLSVHQVHRHLNQAHARLKLGMASGARTLL